MLARASASSGGGGGGLENVASLSMIYGNANYSFLASNFKEAPYHSSSNYSYDTAATIDTPIMTIVKSASHSAQITYKVTCKYVDGNGNVFTKNAGTVDNVTDLYAYCSEYNSSTLMNYATWYGYVE